MVKKYIFHIKNIKRYSSRTVEIYSDILRQYFSFVFDGVLPEGFPHVEPDVCVEVLTPVLIRGYEVHALDNQQLSPRTVNQHLSCLSAFSKYLLSIGVLSNNPVKIVSRPKQSKRVPEIIKKADINEYLRETDDFVFHGTWDDTWGLNLDDKIRYEKRLARLIVALLFSTGIRRGELISLHRFDFYPSRKVLRVHGKGDKIREIPLLDEMIAEIKLYLAELQTVVPRSAFLTSNANLLLTYSCTPLYPQYVERVIKKELGFYAKTSGRLSPHALRHSLATELLNNGAELLSIKELLGHSSLAATQIYTHNSIAKLQEVYSKAHPRAKK